MGIGAGGIGAGFEQTLETPLDPLLTDTGIVFL